ncbi:hypothetical protein AVEN_263631-1 [Araneus ventricosus]|uniref:Uncharacterized protein n=1 Tax=Araneus ventricosus TaxID=182803 RepID=A0A4Y2ASR8_ARAVE|nr:hypothetical protein AVEN_263631-1 [Araneus ventricosus]
MVNNGFLLSIIVLKRSWNYLLSTYSRNRHKVCGIVITEIDIGLLQYSFERTGRSCHVQRKIETSASYCRSLTVKQSCNHLQSACRRNRIGVIQVGLDGIFIGFMILRASLLNG